MFDSVTLTEPQKISAIKSSYNLFHKLKKWNQKLIFMNSLAKTTFLKDNFGLKVVMSMLRHKSQLRTHRHYLKRELLNKTTNFKHNAKYFTSELVYIME